MRIFRLWIDGEIKVVHVDNDCPKCGSIMIVDNLNADLDCVEIGCNHSAPMMDLDLKQKWESMSRLKRVEAYAIPKGYRAREKRKFIEVVDSVSGDVEIRFPNDFPIAWSPTIQWLLQKPWIKSDQVAGVAELDVRAL